jgi:hypothetical protein
MFSWIQKRRDEKDINEYREGFGWAFTQLLLYRRPVDTVESEVFGRYSAFAHGAQYAICVYRNDITVKDPL